MAARPSRGVLARRRLVALVLLAALVTALVLVGQVVVRAVQPMLAGDGEPETGRTAPPTPDALGPAEDCDATSLALSVTPPKAAFTENEAVDLEVTMRHVGARPCLVDGSDAVRQVVVRAGDDVVWSSGHCSDGENLLLMSRGDEIGSTVRWDRHRSVEGCPPDQPLVEPGTYTAVVVVAGIDGATSEPATFEILGPEPSPTSPPPSTDAPATESGETPATQGTATEEPPSPEQPAADGAQGTPAAPTDG